MDKLTVEQAKGQDGTCETVVVNGVRVNAHEANDVAAPSYSKMTKDELKDLLTERSVAFEADATKAELLGLLGA